MKITILTYGSRGDVQPFLALAIGLKKAGHQVQLAAPHRFANFVGAHNIPFTPLAGYPEIISQRLNDAGANPIGMVRAISDYVFSIAGEVLQQVTMACADADLLIHSFLFTAGGHSLARKLGIPDISVQTFPIFAPTRAIPPVFAPNLSGGLLRYAFHKLATEIFWHGGNLGFRRLRKSNPDTFNLKLDWPFAQDASRPKTPLLFAFSPTLIPRPKEWRSANIRIPGYFFLDTPETYQPPEALKDFLSGGKPPVCVTFGSMIHSNMTSIYSRVLEALKTLQHRAIILSGWGGDLQNLSVPENVFVIKTAPHNWLLPQCKLVIHHGGAGTTAAGLRSGIPNLVIPFAADQPFWGQCVHAIGAGPRPIPVGKLTTEKLVSALTTSNSDEIRCKARASGKAIHAENGVQTTINFIETYYSQEYI